jgi:hypothetical protein
MRRLKIFRMNSALEKLKAEYAAIDNEGGRLMCAALATATFERFGNLTLGPYRANKIEVAGGVNYDVRKKLDVPRDGHFTELVETLKTATEEHVLRRMALACVPREIRMRDLSVEENEIFVLSRHPYFPGFPPNIWVPGYN